MQKERYLLTIVCLMTFFHSYRITFASSISERNTYPLLSDTTIIKDDREVDAHFLYEEDEEPRAPVLLSGSEDIYILVDEMPQFPGGEEALKEFIKRNLLYPKECAEMSIQARVIISAVVEQDGILSTIEVIRGVHPSLDEEALKVIKKMPAWIPGKHEGKPLRVRQIIPVMFKG